MKNNYKKDNEGGRQGNHNVMRKEDDWGVDMFREKTGIFRYIIKLKAGNRNDGKVDGLLK